MLCIKVVLKNKRLRGDMSSGADSGGGGGGSGFGYLNFNRVRYANPPLPRRYESIEDDDEDDGAADVEEDEIMGLVDATLVNAFSDIHQR